MQMSRDFTLAELAAEFDGDAEYAAELAQARSRATLATNVNELRRTLGFTQAHLAAAAGTTQAAISRIERGEGNFKHDTLVRIAAALRAELHALFAPRGADVRGRATPRAAVRSGDAARAP